MIATSADRTLLDQLYPTATIPYEYYRRRCHVHSSRTRWARIPSVMAHVSVSLYYDEARTQSTLTGKKPRVKTLSKLVFPQAPSPSNTSLRWTTFLPPQRGIVATRRMWGFGLDSKLRRCLNGRVACLEGCEGLNTDSRSGTENGKEQRQRAVQLLFWERAYVLYKVRGTNKQ